MGDGFGGYVYSGFLVKIPKLFEVLARVKAWYRFTHGRRYIGRVVNVLLCACFIQQLSLLFSLPLSPG